MRHVVIAGRHADVDRRKSLFALNDAVGCAHLVPYFGVFDFSSSRRHTRCLSDWSSDVCSSDLIGHFAAAGEAVCKALFMGGVTRRFPTLRCAFLEGGVGWACNLYADLIGHWDKRNPQGLENYNPANLDREQLADLYWRYGGKLATERFAPMARSGTPPGGPEDGVDDWAACHIARAEDIRDLFIPHFYFGCEADDP